MSITLTTMKSKELWLPICLEWSQSRNWQSSKAEQDPPVHSPTGEVHGLGSGKMGSSLAWDGCWRLLLINSTGSDSAAAALRGWKQGIRLSSTLILLCWPTPLMRWPGLGHGWLRADKSSRDSRIGCAKGPCTTSLFTQCWFCVLPIFFLYVIKVIPEALVKWTVLYIAMEKASLSCTDWACNQRGAEVYACFKFKSQSNRFDSQGWHLIICPTSQVKFRAKFRTNVWTECHDTSVYLCTTCHINM